MKKRLVSALLCLAMAATMLVGCGSGEATEETTETTETTEAAEEVVEVSTKEQAK